MAVDPDSIVLLEDVEMMYKIERLYAKNARLHSLTLCKEDQLSYLGWLSQVAIPWLLHKAKQNGQQDGHKRNSDGEPRANGVRLAKSPFQFMFTQDPKPNTAIISISGNPLAKFLVRHFAKAMRVKFVVHGRNDDNFEGIIK